MGALVPVSHRGLFGLAWPILVQMVSYTMLSVVNSIYVGWLGTSELAAIGLASTLVYLVQAFALGLLGGVRVLVANRTGAGDPEGARGFAWLGLWVGLAGGLVVLATIPLGAVSLRAMGASEAVVGLGAAYFGWRVAAAPLMFVFTALNSAFQGRGDTRTAMVAHVLANLVNLVVDPVLIFGLGPVPALGIAGAAIGSGLGIAAGLGYVGLRARGLLGAPEGAPAGSRVRPTLDGWRELWRIGAPSGVHYALDVSAFVVLAALLARAGEAHVAAHVIVVRVVMASFLPCHALGEAVSVLVAQNVGALRPEDARRALWLGLVQAVSLMATTAGVFVGAPGALVAVFGAAPDVAAIAAPILVLYGVVQVVDGVMVVTFGALTGAGDTRFAMRAGLLASWLVKLPVAGVAVLGLGWGAYGAWTGIGAEIVVGTALAVWRVAGRRWLEVEPRPVAALA
ncbi:MAG: MATE family efflux transporter [Myxococcota bacterium]